MAFQPSAFQNTAFQTAGSSTVVAVPTATPVLTIYQTNTTIPLVMRIS